MKELIVYAQTCKFTAVKSILINKTHLKNDMVGKNTGTKLFLLIVL